MTLLIPNEETRHIDPLGATVSVDRGLRITFSKPNSGARISAPLGAWNLENYAAVAIDIRHLGSKAVALVGEIDQRSWTNSFLHIDVGKTETIVIILQRQELNDQRAEQFVGMRGHLLGFHFNK